MKKTLMAFVGLLLLAGNPVLAGEGWGTDYKKALAASKETGKPVLVDFTGSDWCGWCIRLKKVVFDKDAFKTWAKDKVILLELDFPRRKKQSDEVKKQNRELQKKYGVRGFPTILFLNAKGDVIGKSGYRRGGVEAWTKHADSVIGKKK